MRQIKQLRFSGATTAPVTTLSVQTIDPTGQQYLYTFNLVLTARSQYVGLMVVADTLTERPEQLVVSRDRTATLTDVESGLAIAIRKGFTSRQDPVVESVRQFLALACNGSTIKEAANQANVSLSVVTALAEIALNERLVRSLRPVVNVTHSEVAQPKEAVAPALKPTMENARPKSTTQVEK